MLGQLALHFDMPANADEREAYKDLTYLSQAVHGHCLTLSSAHYRLQRGSARHVNQRPPALSDCSPL